MAAKRKTAKKKSSKRRGKVGAIALPKQDQVMTGLGAIGGLIAVAVINDKLSKMTTPPDPKLVAAGEIVVGFLVPQFVKHPIVTGIGYGMVGAAGLSLAKDAGLIAGLPIVSGYGGNLRAINGPNTMDRIDQGPAGSPKQASTVSQIISGIGSGWYDNGYGE
jgi:hypothetical protein